MGVFCQVKGDGWRTVKPRPRSECVTSVSRSACVECFALVWHHSFRAGNLHGADYSLEQRKHSAFYWLTAAKLLLCKRLIFAGISKWNISEAMQVETETTAAQTDRNWRRVLTGSIINYRGIKIYIKKIEMRISYTLLKDLP